MGRAARLFFVLTFVACSDEPRAECQLNSDCPKNVLCTGGLCVPECRENRDCLGEAICVVNRCVLPDPGEPFCFDARDCDGGQICQAGVCGTIGLVGQDGGVDAGPTDVGPFDAGAGVDVGFVDGGIDGGVTLLPYGAICTRGSQCASGSCLGPAGATSGRCTITCTADPQCFYPDRCVDVPGAGKFCGPAAGGRATGEACPGGPTDCATGLCVTPPASPAICTHQCSPLPSCPPMLACAPVADGQGGAVALCLPGTGAGFGELCSGASQCASTLCVGLTGGASGICTSFCDVVPCPVGWSCNTVGDGSGGTVDVCAPGAAQGAAFGAACSAASECQSQLCLANAQTGGAYCTQRCGSAADCPAIPGLTLDCFQLSTGDQVCAPI